MHVQKLKTSILSFTVFLFSVGFLFVLLRKEARERSSGREGYQAEVKEKSSEIHLLNPYPFIVNKGQWDAPFRYMARMPGVDAFLEDYGWTLILKETPSMPKLRLNAFGMRDHKFAPPLPRRGAPIRMNFEGEARQTEIIPGNRVEGSYNFFLGKESSRWKTDLPGFDSVTYKGVYPGIDVRVHSRLGRFEYDLNLHPGADLSKVVLKVEGARSMKIAKDGALLMDTTLGTLRQPKPLTLEETPHGSKRLLPCRYVLLGKRKVGFKVKGWHGKTLLTIDPSFVWGTYLGGLSDEFISNCKFFRNNGETICFGNTLSFNYPTTLGAFQRTLNGKWDIIVSRISSSGTSLIYSTYIGGNNYDFLQGNSEYFNVVLVGANGTVTLCGKTNSDNYPTTPGAFQRIRRGLYDFFLTRLGPKGRSLVFSTLIGGSRDEDLPSISLQPGDLVDLVGITKSPDYPTTAGVFQGKFGGGKDVAISCFEGNGKIRFSTFLGGESDESRPLHIYQGGRIYVFGSTFSRKFPVSNNAYQNWWRGGWDNFVTCIKGDGSNIIFSTFLGGSNNERFSPIGKIDQIGNLFLCGVTSSSDFPVSGGAFQKIYGGGTFDAYVAKFDPKGNCVFSSFLGGRNEDFISYQFVLDENFKTFYVAGVTKSSDFPTTKGAFQTRYSGGKDCWIAKFSFNGALKFSTLLGGTRDEAIDGITIHGNGNLYFFGGTGSNDLPTTSSAFQKKYGGGVTDGFFGCLDFSGSMLFLTYLGGGISVGTQPGGGDGIDFISVDQGGLISIIGFTQCIDFPITTGAFQTRAGKNLGRDYDVYFAQFSPLGKILYSSYLGGDGDDRAYSFDRDEQGLLTLQLLTNSVNLPVSSGAFQKGPGGMLDGYFCRLDFMPKGVERVGHSTSGCTGFVSLYPNEMPQAGLSKFGFLTTNAPRNGFGVFLLGLNSSKFGIPLLGADLFLNPSKPIWVFSIYSDSSGVSRIPLPLPPWKGAKFAVQTIWAENQVCPGGKPLCSSWGLEVTTQ